MNTQIDKTLKVVGERIAEARQIRAEEIDSVAKAVGLTAQTMNEIESGRYYDLEVRTLLDISGFLQIPVSELMRMP